VITFTHSFNDLGTCDLILTRVIMLASYMPAKARIGLVSIRYTGVEQSKSTMHSPTRRLSSMS
jgi:hypothetical protein